MAKKVGAARPKEIVEYRHYAPVKVPPADVEPAVMHEVLRRVEAVLDPARGVLSEELSRDICRVLASRHREWMRADRAEQREASRYTEGWNARASACCECRLEQLAERIRSALNTSKG